MALSNKPYRLKCTVVFDINEYYAGGYLYYFISVPPHSTTVNPSLVGETNFYSSTVIALSNSLNLIPILITVSGTEFINNGILYSISSDVSNLI